MMKRLLILLLASALILGCAQKQTTPQKQPTVTPVKITPTKNITTPESITPPESIPADINKTLTDVNELLKELQEIENVSFNL